MQNPIVCRVRGESLEAICSPVSNAGQALAPARINIDRGKNPQAGNQFSPCIRLDALPCPHVVQMPGLEKAAPNVCIVATQKKKKTMNNR